jgi:hypothetical protein
MLIDIAAARRNVRYDPETGFFYWLVDKRGPVKAGDRAGTVGAKGYLYVKIEQRKYAAARLAWAMFHGMNPPDEVDHKDRDRANNRISNLRLATRQQNAENVTGEGVRFEKDRQKWLARVTVEYHEINLGRYDTKAEALAAVNAAKQILRGEYAGV